MVEERRIQKGVDIRNLCLRSGHPEPLLQEWTSGTSAPGVDIRNLCSRTKFQCWAQYAGYGGIAKDPELA
ncbi:hypothetical protein STEG23_005513 [Scotinomys teguina]